jgi:DUF971 family protein
MLSQRTILEQSPTCECVCHQQEEVVVVDESPVPVMFLQPDGQYSWYNPETKEWCFP